MSDINYIISAIYTADPNEDLAAVGRALAEVLLEQEGVTRVRVYLTSTVPVADNVE